MERTEQEKLEKKRQGVWFRSNSSGNGWNMLELHHANVSSFTVNAGASLPETTQNHETHVSDLHLV